MCAEGYSSLSVCLSLCVFMYVSVTSTTLTMLRGSQHFILKLHLNLKLMATGDSVPVVDFKEVFTTKTFPPVLKCAATLPCLHKGWICHHQQATEQTHDQSCDTEWSPHDHEVSLDSSAPSNGEQYSGIETQIRIPFFNAVSNYLFVFCVPDIFLFL